MKKTACLAVCLMIFVGCGQKRDLVEKLEENGIEVVVNNINPYRFPKARTPSDLEEEITIDLEDKVIAQTGLYRLDTFTVDSTGNIYILNQLRFYWERICRRSLKGIIIGQFLYQTI